MALNATPLFTVRQVPGDEASEAVVAAISDVLYRYKAHVQRLWAEAPTDDAALTAVAGGPSPPPAAQQQQTEPRVTQAPPCLERTRRGVAALLANPDLGLLFVAEAAAAAGTESTGTICAVAVVHREVSDWRAGFVWYVNTIAVDPMFPAIVLGGGIGLPPVLLPAAADATTAKDSGNYTVDTAAARAVLALIDGIRAAVAADETANGIRVMIEDPFDIMRRRLFASTGQFEVGNIDAHRRHRSDSSAANAALLCEAAGHHPSGSGLCAGFAREHYFMMTWFRDAIPVGDAPTQ